MQLIKGFLDEGTGPEKGLYTRKQRKSANLNTCHKSDLNPRSKCFSGKRYS
jgi:hypothetical protein